MKAMTTTLDEMMKRADPDSIMGLIRSMKENADEIERLRQPAPDQTKTDES